jgi:phosphate transport system protein
MHPHMQREIEKLKKKLLTVSAKVETVMQKAVRSLMERNDTLAQEVIDGDPEIDQMEVDVEEEVLKILALYSPVANDLRFVVAVLKINNDLERIADEAVNIAERTIFLSKHPKIKVPEELTTMVNLVESMLDKTLHALINMDSKLAAEVILNDDKVDDLHKYMYTLIQNRIKTDIEHVECLINILSVSRQLERIADQVTNIAEDVVYMVEGNIVRHKSIS